MEFENWSFYHDFTIVCGKNIGGAQAPALGTRVNYAPVDFYFYNIRKRLTSRLVNFMGILKTKTIFSFKISFSICL